MLAFPIIGSLLVASLAAAPAPGLAGGPSAPASHGTSGVEAAADEEIRVGQTVTSELTASDPTMADGSHYDTWTFQGRAGQQIVATMRSSAFDTYLSVGRTSGGTFTALQSDDDGAGGTDSRVTLQLPADGSYVIRANSLGKGQQGAYTLSLEGAASPGGGAAATSSTVRLQLDSAAILMRKEGFNPAGSPQTGSLRQGETRELSVTLTAGRSYVFVGVCDTDCSDLDLAVTGPDGAAIGADTKDDDVPMVIAENAARAGVYRVRVSMPGCTGQSCGFAMAVFGN